MPRFRFKRSVGQDLRDQFGHDRLKAQARGLGHSSISPGEGSLGILDASSNPVARYGHYAGKAGFLIPDGAGWQTIQEYTDAAAGALDGRMTTAEGRLDDHAGRIGAVEGVNTTQNGRLDDHAGRLGASENDITDLENNKVGFSTYNVLAGRVGAAENDIDDIVDGTTALQTPKLNAPTINSIMSQPISGSWKPLLVNTTNGLVAYAGD